MHARLNPFEGLLRDTIAPALAPKGFLRPGAQFGLRRTGDWGIVHIQRSTKSTVTKLVITANLAVSIGILRAAYGEPTGRMPSYGDAHWRCRLGDVLASPTDRWWDIEVGHPRSADEFLDVLLDLGIPAVLQTMSAERVRDMWLMGGDPNDFYRPITQRLVDLTILLRELGPDDALPGVTAQLREEARESGPLARVDASTAARVDSIPTESLGIPRSGRRGREDPP